MREGLVALLLPDQGVERVLQGYGSAVRDLLNALLTIFVSLAALAGLLYVLARVDPVTIRQARHVPSHRREAARGPAMR
jgi:hypothetical protein